ncbi:hypothetical protein BTI_5629 [Burkholderia thailandensis MSMB121]|nr:hypothetical protein [Burkholderia humptydooensis]AGK50647.1 hypothetical protein BTI_5629 [Burkholderia thailandensis MSMB121]
MIVVPADVQTGAVDRVKAFGAIGFVAKLVMLLADAAIRKMKAALEQFLDAL